MEKRTPEDEESIRNHDESAFYAVHRYVEEHGLEFKEEELNEVIMQCKPTIKYFKETFNVPRPHEVVKILMQLEEWIVQQTKQKVIHLVMRVKEC